MMSPAALTALGSRPNTDVLKRWLAHIVCAACVGAVVSVLIVTYQRANALFNQYDDAYITLRYAVNLATGKGLVYNVGVRTDAASSFAYTLALALCYRLGAHDLELVSTLMNLAAVAGTVIIVFRACLLRTGHLAVAAFLAAAVGFSGMGSGWWASGMETGVFAFLVSASVYRMFFIRRLDWHSTLLACVTFLVRLEGTLFIVAILLLLAREFREATGKRRVTVLRMGGAVVLTVLGFFALKTALYGTPVPHSFVFKSVSGMYPSDPAAVWNAWTTQSLGILVLGTAGLVMQPRRLESWILGSYVVLSAVSLAVGPFSDYARYSVHMFPVLAMLASVPLATLAYLGPILALGLCALITVQTYESYQLMLGYAKMYARHQDCRKQVGRYIEEHVKPRTKVVSSDIGAIAYAAPSASFIDTIALTSSDYLQRRMDGEGVDDILNQAADGLVADTCSNSCRRWHDYSAYVRLADESVWKTVVPKSRYGEDFRETDPLFTCRSPDGFSFAVSRFRKP